MLTFFRAHLLSLPFSWFMSHTICAWFAQLFYVYWTNKQAFQINRESEKVLAWSQPIRRNKGGKAPPSLIKGGVCPSLKKACNPCRGWGARSPPCFAIKRFMNHDPEQIKNSDRKIKKLTLVYWAYSSIRGMLQKQAEKKRLIKNVNINNK